MKNILTCLYLIVLSLNIANCFIGFETLFILPSLLLIVSVIFLIKYIRKPFMKLSLFLLLFITPQFTGWAVSHFYGYHLLQNRPAYYKQEKKRVNAVFREAINHCLYMVNIEKKTSYRSGPTGLSRNQFYLCYFTPLKLILKETLKPETVAHVILTEEGQINLILTKKWINSVITKNRKNAVQAYLETLNQNTQAVAL